MESVHLQSTKRLTVPDWPLGVLIFPFMKISLFASMLLMMRGALDRFLKGSYLLSQQRLSGYPQDNDKIWPTGWGSPLWCLIGIGNKLRVRC